MADMHDTRGDGMTGNIWADCSRVLNRYHCQIVAGIIAVLLPAVSAGLAWYVSASGELERVTIQTESRSISTAQALDALTAEVREQSAETSHVLSLIQSDIRLITYRLDNRAGLRVPETDARLAFESEP